MSNMICQNRYTLCWNGVSPMTYQVVSYNSGMTHFVSKTTHPFWIRTINDIFTNIYTTVLKYFFTITKNNIPNLLIKNNSFVKYVVQYCCKATPHAIKVGLFMHEFCSVMVILGSKRYTKLIELLKLDK